MTYEITLERLVTVLQTATVTVFADTEEDAIEEAMDTASDWKDQKIINSEGRELVDVVERG